MDRSPGFGPCAHRLLPSSDSISLRVLGSFLFPSPGRAARRTVLQKVRGHTSTSSAPAGRRHRVSGSLSLPSRGPFHLSLTVLVAIGHCTVFSLGRWSSRLQAGFLVSRATPDSACPFSLFVYGAFTPSGRLSQNRSTKGSFLSGGPYPRMQASWFGLLRFRSPLLAESIFLSFPPGT